MVTKKSIIKILLILSCIFATESFAQKKVALVIGNSDYQIGSLRNSTNDARDISKVLRSLGFEVDVKLNASQADMEDAVQRFGKKLQGNTVGLFYFSGHGVQYEGNNYLIPIGAMSRVSKPEQLHYKTVDAAYISGVMEDAGNGLNMVVLDACRDNPFKSFSRGMNKGLTRIPGAKGTLIAYAASPGKVASDGSGKNSPYAEQLIKMMKKPNLPVEAMFKQVKKAVNSKTGGEQSPWYEASINGNFYFSGNVQAQSCVQLCDEDFLKTATTAQIRTAIANEGVTARNEDGWTALHWASEWGPPETVSLLLAAGADIKARDKNGKTAFDLARNNDEIKSTDDVYRQLRDAQCGFTKKLFNYLDGTRKKGC